MNEIYFAKFKSWVGKCGAYAKHHGMDKELVRMNCIANKYYQMALGTKENYFPPHLLILRK